MERNRLIAKAEIVFSMAVFGTISIFVRNIPLPSAELALCRAVIAAATLLVWQLLTRTMVRFQDIKKELPLLLLSGAAMGVNWILFFQAYKYTSVALATLSYYFAPVLVTVASPLLFQERLTGRQMFCFVMSTLGLVLVIGVNGVGKTTSVGKLAGKLKDQGKKVILAAADTFRAAAGTQLKEWANRAGVEMIGGQEGADPGAIVYDAVAAAKARNADVLLCDTAGRLHNKKNLMEELRKINRILEKEYPDAFRETLVVLDATTGQNALAQAREFAEVADITGIILTKMDGTAKGGIAVAIHSELGIPVKYIGVGETIEDLQKFDSNEFVNALFDVKEEK